MSALTAVASLGDRWSVTVSAAESPDASALVDTARARGPRRSSEFDYALMGLGYVRTSAWEPDGEAFTATVVLAPQSTCPVWCSTHASGARETPVAVLSVPNGPGMDGEVSHERVLGEFPTDDGRHRMTITLLQVDQLHEGQYFAGTPGVTVDTGEALVCGVDVVTLGGALLGAKFVVNALTPAVSAPDGVALR